MMAVVGGVVVFLVACCLVVLVAIYRRLSEIGDRLAAHLTGLDEAAARRAEEDRKHRDATSAIVVGVIREVGEVVVKELGRQARQRHAMVQGLIGIRPHDRASEEELEPPASTSQRRTPGTPGVSMLPPDAPTPPTGYAVGVLLAEAEGEAP